MESGIRRKNRKEEEVNGNDAMWNGMEWNGNGFGNRVGNGTGTVREGVGFEF